MFDERFRKAPILWRISVDGRPNRRNKAAFSEFSDAVWTGPYAHATDQIQITLITRAPLKTRYSRKKSYHVSWAKNLPRNISPQESAKNFNVCDQISFLHQITLMLCIYLVNNLRLSVPSFMWIKFIVIIKAEFWQEECGRKTEDFQNKPHFKTKIQRLFLRIILEDCSTSKLFD